MKHYAQLACPYWSTETEWDLIRCALDHDDVMVRCQSISASDFHDPAHAILWASLQWLDSVGAELSADNLELISGQPLRADVRDWIDDTTDSLAAALRQLSEARRDDREGYVRDLVGSEENVADILVELAVTRRSY